MHEIDEARLRNVLCQTVLLLEVQLVPAHVWNTQVRGKPDDGALKQVESLVFAKLLAFAEQQMHSKRDSQTRCSRVHFLDEWLGETQLVQVPHSVTERANAGKDQLCRCSNVIRIRSYEDVVSQPPQRVLQ